MPNHDEIIRFANQLECDDTQYVDIFPTNITASTCGMVTYKYNGIMHEIYIKLADDYHRTINRDTNKIPLAVLIYAVGIDTPMICINSVFRNMALDYDNFGNIINGIIGHELGHIFAKHKLYSKDLTDRISNIPRSSMHDFYRISEGLLSGGYYTREYDADRYVAALYGLDTLVVMLSYMAIFTAGNIGVRKEFENRIKQHVHGFKHGKQYLPDISNISDVTWRVLSDEELNDITE